MLFLFNHFKIPRIPTGATWFGIGSLSYGIWSNRNRNVPAGGQQVEEINKIQSDLEIIRQQNDEILRNQNKSLKEKLFDLFSNKKNKLSDESSILDNILDYIQSYSDFLQNLTFEQQIILFNFLCSILLLSYIVSILIIFYSNYLIERFDLEKRIPRIAVFLRYRAKFQKYYLYWNTICIIIILIVLSTTNFVLFLDFYF